MRKLRLGRETLADLTHDQLANLAGGGPETYTCFASDGLGPCVLTLVNCRFTATPCLFTGTPSTDICV